MNTTPFNVLSNASRDSMSTVDQVSQMLSAPGVSKSERKQIRRALNKTRQLTSKAQARLDQSAYEKYRDITDMEFVHFNAVLALTMYHDYRWTEDDSQEHGQITSLMERIQKRMRKYQEAGKTTKDIVKELEEKTGIVLVPDTGFPENY